MGSLRAGGAPYPTGSDPYGVYAADFNGDGRPDVAALNGSSSNVNLYLRQAAGGFADGGTTDLGAETGPSFAAVGDYNGDGRSDLAVANFAGSESRAGPAPQPGGRAGDRVRNSGSGRQASAIGAGDFNSDGRTDLAVAFWTAATSSSFSATPRTTASIPAPASPPATIPRQIDVADFNGDSLADIAVTNAGSDTVTVLLRQVGGGFASEGAAIPVGTSRRTSRSPTSTATAARTSRSRTTAPDTVSVLLRNVANNGFTEETGSPIAVTADPVGITAADFNADGRTDLAVASQAAPSACCRRAAGGGFVAETPIAMPSAYGIATADFDADGRPDLAVTSLGPVNQMRVLPQPWRRATAGADAHPAAQLPLRRRSCRSPSPGAT